MSKFTVFLADGEIVVREGIRSNFPWEETDFVLVGEAPDGEIALNMMQDIKPYILITDIRMPFMDGLALCRKVRETMPWVYMIILSGFDDFTYAKEAISIGVEEYLLKPVSSRELLEVLHRISVRIKEDKQQQDYLRAFQDQLRSSASFLKEKLLQDLLRGAIKEDFHQKARPLQMNLLANWYSVILLKPFSAQSDPFHGQERTTARSILSRLSDSSESSVYFCEIDSLFAFIVLGDTQTDLEERAYGLAQAAQFDVARNTSFQFLVAIGKPSTFLNKVYLSYQDAQQVMMQIANQSAPRIMSREDVANSDPFHKFPDFSSMDFAVTPISEQLKYAEAEDVKTILTHYIESMGGTAFQSAVFSDYLYVDILRVASRIIKESGGEPQEVIPSAFTEKNKFLTKLPSLYEELEKMLVAALSFRDRHSMSHYGPLIRQATAFLHQQYSDSSLMLKDVASHVSLSNNHFCTVFSQETGVTYTEYLTHLRLNKAKDLLLTTSMRTSDIAYQVGYNDPHYFSYLFKKNVGFSPRDYRKQQQE